MRPPPFETFLEQHRGAVYRLLLATVGPNHADDCFQETFLAALRAYPSLRDTSNLRAWVLTIATRKALDHGRRSRRAPMPVAELPEDAQGGSETADAGMLDPSIWSAVAALPAKQRAAVVHRYVLDLPYGDIARVLNCSEEAARASASEGRRKLRALLTDRREEVTR